MAAVNWQLLDRALIHPSFSAINNDELEFFGDSALRMAVTCFLWRHYGDRRVGELTALRSTIVSDDTLYRIAHGYALDRYLLVGAAVRDDPKAQKTILADALEAVLGALYFSTEDLSLIQPWLDPHLRRVATHVLSLPAMGNYKAKLQECTQRLYKCLPEYRTLNQNPPFQVEVWLGNRLLGQGEGSNLKSAQQSAAAIALQNLEAAGSTQT
jgi:ribonuclease-3